jgi:class 3 adenylate cyclase
MRVPRSFAFVDLCGFTRFTDAHGDEQAVDVLMRFRAATRQISSDHGVRVAKWLGDGAMFVSTDEQQLVLAILALARRAEELDVGLPLRAGMASGAVILFEGDDYIGGAVNLAARLCDMAAPQEVLASAELAACFDDSVECIDIGPRPVAGFVQQVEVVRVEPAGVAARR